MWSWTRAVACGFALLLLAAPSGAGNPVGEVPDGCETSRSTGYFPGEDSNPVWSPDGTRLLFHRVWPGQICLAVLDLRTGAIAAIDGSIYTSSVYAWAPDGSRVVFAGGAPSRVLSRHGLFVADPSGRTRPRRLTHGTVAGLRWSPDGRNLAWTGSGPAGPRRDGHAHVWALSLASGKVRQLTWGAAEDMWPAWSPDGRRVVFVRCVCRRDVDGELFAVDASSTGLTRLTYGARATSPAWSPDGATIAYSTPGRQVTIVTTRGRVLRRFGRRAGEPAWSPDGTRIAFHAQVPGIAWARARIEVARADGSAARPLVRGRPPVTRGGSDHEFAWSPDGSLIAFAHGGEERTGTTGLYVVRADGTGLKQLTRVPVRP